MVLENVLLLSEFVIARRLIEFTEAHHVVFVDELSLFVFRHGAGPLPGRGFVKAKIIVLINLRCCFFRQGVVEAYLGANSALVALLVELVG